MDPLSDVLSLLKPQSYVSRGFDVGADAAIQWPKHEGIKCYAVLAGECWLTVEGVPDPVHLTTGDCFLLPRGLPFALTTDLALTPLDFRIFVESMKNSGITPPPGVRGNYIAGAHFILSGSQADMLLKALPPIVHIRAEADKAAMRWSMERMREELQTPQPGGSLIAQQLASMMLVQALRLYLAEGAKDRVSWLSALSDRQLSAAITCMHDDPGHPWTLQVLAAHVGMSRSIFALRFREVVGSTPMEYLTRWRMMLAESRLTNSSDAVSEIARSLGYDSESAFSKAFRRVTARSPRQCRRDQTTMVPARIEAGPNLPAATNAP